MTLSDFMRCCGSSFRRGLSLVEMLISIPLVGIALVAALNTVGASRLAQFKVNVGREGHLLAQELMSEILQQDYADVEIAQAVRDDILSKGDAAYTGGPDNFSGEDEMSTGDRSLFDDVDDYDKWTASPPQGKDGRVYAALTAWERSVSVVFTNVNDLKAIRANDFGWKRITVTVTYNDVPAAELVALKAIGLPWLEACCLDGGSCADLRAEACAAQGGTAQGPETKCATTECPIGLEVLFVTGGTCYMVEGQEQPVCTPTEQEAPRITLMESWGFTVTLIADDALQSDFDAAIAEADVAYVGSSISGGALAHKLTGKTIGIVFEFPGKLDNFGLSSGTFTYVKGDTVLVVDNSHYITSVFSVGSIAVSAVLFDMSIASGTLAPDLQNLAEISGQPAVCALDTGGRRFDGGAAPARRVHLPYANAAASSLTADAQMIMKRAITWAAGMDKVCGDGTCDVGEECSCPDDCGDPVAFEQPGVSCADGLDNDCDGTTDCDDINCPSDPACVICGNGICESGENCNNCSTDCPSVTTGKPSSQYCCGNGIAESAEGDGSICDGNY